MRHEQKFKRQVWSVNLWYAYSVTFFDNMGAFHTLTYAIFVRNDLYQLKSAMCQKLFSYSKSGRPHIWLDSDNYSSNFYLVALSKEIDCDRKDGERNNAYWTRNNHYIWNRRMRVCSSLLKLRNKILRVYPSLAVRPKKSRGENYANHNRTNKIN